MTTEHSIFNLTDDDDDEATGEHEREPDSEPDGEDAPGDEEAGDGDSDESAEAETEAEKLEDGSSTVRLLVGEILVIPSDNVSRGGHMVPANHPDIQSLAKSITSEGLLHHVGVRPLPEPIERPESEIEADRARHGQRSDRFKRGGKKLLFSIATHYTHRLVYGFERYVAVRDVLNWYTIPCVSKERTDAEALSACLAENTGRRDPTDYDLAVGFALMMSAVVPRMSWEQASDATGCRAARVRTLVTIVERCPPALLDVFRVSPTAETRRTLERIAVMVDPENKEQESVRHRMMLDEWARLSALPAGAGVGAGANQSQHSRGGGDGRKAITIGRAKPIDAVKLSRLRDTLANASEWLDPVAGWQPMSQETKAALDALLRHTIDPKGQARPVR